MKTVTDDPYEFYKEGGWDFLQTGENGEDGSDEESSAESAFDPVGFESGGSAQRVLTTANHRDLTSTKNQNRKAVSVKTNQNLMHRTSHSLMKGRIGVNRRKRQPRATRRKPLELAKLRTQIMTAGRVSRTENLRSANQVSSDISRLCCIRLVRERCRGHNVKTVMQFILSVYHRSTIWYIVQPALLLSIEVKSANIHCLYGCRPASQERKDTILRWLSR